MSDQDLKAAEWPSTRVRCDHICLLDDGHIERGEPHFYGYELPSPRAELNRRFLLLRSVLSEYVAGNRIVDGYWYSPDETGAPHYRNDLATADELALVESLRTEVGL